MRNKLLFVFCLLPFFAFPAWAVEHPLADADEEARAEALFHQIRCVACQTESLAESPADVASDIRQTIRVRVAAGDSTNEIKKYLAKRYGDAVLMRPPLSTATAILWFGPTLLLIIGIAVIWISVKMEAAKEK